MKRLTFLLACAAGLLAGAMTDALAQKKGKPVYSFPLGVQAYTYRNHFPKDVAATLDIIQKLGFKELEGGAPRGLTPEEFKKMCDARGIKIPSTGAGYEQIVKDPQDVAQLAKALGASYVMVAWIPHQKGNFTLENAKQAVEDFNRVGKVLQEQGITFCYHNHGYEFQPYGQGTLFDYMVENTDPKYVSFEMDVLWTKHGGADPVALLNKYGNRFKLMHLKDLKKGVVGDLTGGTPAENDVPLGTGQIDFPAVLKAAKKAGIKHYFIEDESDRELEYVPKSIAYLTGLRE
ncbi:sugar phosphate isomerase/epimerase [Rhabdobacter roseus]|uniref:Sugar phosphate isomerase/epimerase n=1 Tax=Rhabdobacter roseus TaxID=1655419 RepID=A0A840U3A9_9BACT|nr:sugar phosphate isomerase/epimerase [Rhabdobacter roseus]MBB5286818.1 sugar phosphate isomerase/epimerase [Rhabdobacter roseus]